MASELRFWKTVPGFEMRGRTVDLKALEQRMRRSEM